MSEWILNIVLWVVLSVVIYFFIRRFKPRLPDLPKGVLQVASDGERLFVRSSNQGDILQVAKVGKDISVRSRDFDGFRPWHRVEKKPKPRVSYEIARKFPDIVSKLVAQGYSVRVFRVGKFYVNSAYECIIYRPNDKVRGDFWGFDKDSAFIGALADLERNRLVGDLCEG